MNSSKNMTRSVPTYSCLLPNPQRHISSLHLSCDRNLRYRTCVVEHSFTCPFCGEEISMVLDLSARRHTYVEDCEVCCNPPEISYTVEDDSLTHFEAKSLE
jgi:predicted RNA-binding Zn-ribbon protein involved in translation (DUF1610 family)